MANYLNNKDLAFKINRLGNRITKVSTAIFNNTVETSAAADDMVIINKSGSDTSFYNIAVSNLGIGTGGGTAIRYPYGGSAWEEIAANSDMYFEVLGESFSTIDAKYIKA